MTLNDITALLHKMKPSFSPTDILPTALFLTFLSIGPCTVKLFNVSLSTGVVPSFFKHSVVESTHKKPSLDSSTPKSYRQISKLPFISKILEKVVTEQHLTFLENHDVFDTFQSGFHKKHSSKMVYLKFLVIS